MTKDQAMIENIRDLRAELVEARSEQTRHEERKLLLQLADADIKRLTQENNELLNYVKELREQVDTLTVENIRLHQVIDQAAEHAAARGRMGILRLLK